MTHESHAWPRADGPVACTHDVFAKDRCAGVKAASTRRAPRPPESRGHPKITPPRRHTQQLTSTQQHARGLVATTH